MVETFAVIGVMFIAVLFVVAYFPIQAQLDSDWFIAYSWGYMISKMFPVIMTTLGVMFSLAILYVSSQSSVGQR